MTVPTQAVHVDSPTETRNPRTTDIDLMSTAGILGAINAEDRTVAGAVAAVLPQVARAVDYAVDALRAGGRVHYVGAGTSGRLATLDAAELVPTFNVPADWFIAHHAGGERALRQRRRKRGGRRRGRRGRDGRHGPAGRLRAGADGVGPDAVRAGRAGRPRRARAPAPGWCRATRRPPSPAGVDVLIAVDTGPEAIAGSTRMKAGTAQKMILTSFSTATMIKLGRTYSNLMVSMRATNAKLRGRTIRILQEATGMTMADCSDALTEAGGDLKVALVHLLSGEDVKSAAKALHASGGHVRKALDLVRVRAS